MEELLEPKARAQAIRAQESESSIRDLPISIAEKRQRRLVVLSKKFVSFIV